MPTLDWIGKQAVVNHHREVPYRLVHCDSDLSAGDPDAGNLLVQGDNLEALRALLPYYAGQVKCIYIDPPYNTGNEEWRYNDNVNSPEIKAWLDTVVGKEGEDLSRHDKWLCMMYPRLRLLRDFLRDDGIIFISIDDIEHCSLMGLCNELFGKRNFVGSFVWAKKRKGSYLSKSYVSVTEYVVAYRKNHKIKLYGGAPDADESQPLIKRTNSVGILNFPSGSISTKIGDKTLKAGVFGKGSSSVELLSDATIEGGRFITPVSLRGPFIWSQSYLDDQLSRGSTLTANTMNLQVRAFKAPDNDASKGLSSFIDGVSIGSTNEDAYEELEGIFAEEGSFNYPKPSGLIKHLVQAACYWDRDAIVMDTFSGSGTTGHAVLSLNKQDAGNRRFILVEMDKSISENVTAERLRRVISGYDKGGDKTKPMAALGGGFRFCQLGKPLFDEYGDIAPEVTFPDLAAHIFFSETGVPIPAKAASEFLGVFQDRAVYLLYDAAHVESPREAVGNVLTPDRLDALPQPPEGFEGLRVVYGEGCTVSAGRMKTAGVVFKQIPYQIDGA
ncbi:site-specific DNA-methyltransferase [Litorimonas cladophorae]|uniref:site-specific DNA-methyltransferase (adenine-specific) n=1 Tax=Litorimonas cladophorae TaxID=1220491 RepID=A0A918KTR4_9PROT|nr:site-specific DNA-methyltransferase [Litorimonas cladophorae]GGX73172.1 site-specific DNA-methyltransferase [Litorimonas cladophorae]